MSFVVSRVSQFQGFGFIGFVEGFKLTHVGFCSFVVSGVGRWLHRSVVPVKPGKGLEQAATPQSICEECDSR